LRLFTVDNLFGDDDVHLKNPNAPFADVASRIAPNRPKQPTIPITPAQLITFAENKSGRKVCSKN